MSDGDGGTSTATVYVYLADQPPVAADTSVNVHSAAVTVDVLANDSSPANDVLTVTSVGTPGHGSAVINADNTITYTPTSGTTAATDSFTYSISDGDGGTSTGTVYVYLADQPPTGNDVSANVHSAAVTIDVLADDVAAEGSALTVTSVGTAAHGTVVLNADNTVTYTPTSGTTAATDSFTYTVSDGYGGNSTATVYLYLADQPPTAGDAFVSTHSAAVTIDVLSGDSAADGDTLTVTSVGTAAHGSVVINADNTMTYTPTSGTTAATDAFTYTIADGYGGTSSGTVYVYLTDQPPVASDVVVSTHSAAVTIDVLAGDYSPDGDTLTVSSVATPPHGTTVINADNTVTYTPATGGTFSSDTFTYTLADGYGGTSTGTVVVFLSDRAPVALDVAASTHSAAVTIAVLAEAADADADALTVTTIGTPAHGTAVLNADNTVTYTPTSGTTASTDSFSYTVSDGHGGTSTATVSVQLADRAPYANSDYVTAHSAAVTIALLATDSDPDGDPLTVTAVGTPTSGTAVLNADNTVTYTPNSGTTASSDRFSYTVADGYGGTSTATVYVQLADQAPTALGVSASTHSAAVTIDVLADDGDRDGSPLTVTSVGTAGNGTAVLNADSTVTYTPNSGTTASTDSFTYTIADGHGGTSTNTVTVQLADQAPVALAVTAATHTTAVTVDVLAGDSDPDGDALTVTAVGTPAHGTAVLNADNTVTYTPNAGTTATTDTFTYTVSDGHGGSSTASVTIELSNQQPIAANVSASTPGAPVTIAVLAGDADPAGEPLTLTALGTPSNGSATINADGTVSYVPTGSGPFVDEFSYTITDGHGGTSNATIAITVGTTPIAVNDQTPAYTGLPVTLAVLANDADPYGDPLSITAVGTPSHGTAYVNADGTITYMPTPGTTATSDTFTYTIGDAHGGTSTATATIFLQDVPVANNVSYSPAHQHVPVTLDVLAGDYDPDGETLTLTALGTTSYGTAVINADGTVTYTANFGTSGHTDVFTYSISDGHGGTSMATISITIV